MPATVINYIDGGSPPSGANLARSAPGPISPPSTPDPGLVCPAVINSGPVCPSRPGATSRKMQCKPGNGGPSLQAAKP